MTAPAVAPFRRRTLALLIAVGAISLAITLALLVLGDRLGEQASAGPDGTSRSAIGHRGLIDVLRALDVPVVVSRHRGAERARDGVLVIVAPDLARDGERGRDPVEELRALARAAPRVLVVLPRWDGVADAGRPGWIAERWERPARDAQAVLDALGVDAVVAREPAGALVATGRGEGLAAMPSIARPQLVVDADLEPAIEAEDGGILLGHTWLDQDTKLWLLADPSPLDNAGLRDRDNLHFAVALIDELRQGGPVVFDQTSHGLVEAPSLWRQLFRFPLVLVTLQAGICALLLLWAAIGRWGPARAAAPPLPSGKDFLIRNTASLMHLGGHDGDALRRYLAISTHAVAQALHAPRDLAGAALGAWLERVRAARGVTIALPDLEREVAAIAGARRARAADVVAAATRIHRWRTEMTHGPRKHP